MPAWIRVVGLSLVAAALAVGARGAAPEKKPVAGKEWDTVIEVPSPPRYGKEQPPASACLWLPEGAKKVRGLYYGGPIIIGKKLGTDPAVREALAQERMGVLYFPLRSDLIHGAGERLEKALAQLAKASGHPEVEFAPLLTAGHSADGLFCRNVAYWKPERVIGVVMIKSGNFHHAIEDVDRSLRGVPLIHFSGEFEEYGPEGGDLGRGLRSAYATTGADGRTRNQTQWVMTRMQMLDRRRKNEDNVWTLAVHRGGGHTAWNQDLTALFIQYVHSLAAVRIPKEEPDGKTVVHCIPMSARGGWLCDADIKDPKCKPAPYAEYQGDRNLAFWAPDKAMAMAIWDYHQREPWPHPDPTAGKPVAERFYPPLILKDFVDGPPPDVLTWSGGDGAWDDQGTAWRQAGRPVPWDPAKQAVFEGRGGTVTVPANQSSAGLVLGRRYTLELGESRLGVRWKARIEDGATVRVRLHAKSPAGAGRWGAALAIDGNAALGGTLVVEVGEPLKEGDYGVCTVKGVRTGDFSKAVIPPPYTGGWIGSTFCVTVPPPPKVLSPQETKKRAEEAARKKEAEVKKALGLPGPPADPGPPPQAPDMALPLRPE